MSDLIYRPLVEGMTWSYSRIRCFSDCPYRWFLIYIAHEKEEPMFYSDYGSFIHDLLARYYLGLLSEDGMREEFVSCFRDRVGGERPDSKIVTNYIADGISYLDHFSPLPFRMLGVEQKINFDIHGLPFVGFIDYIGEDKDGLVIVDHKSRSMKPRSRRKSPTANDKQIDDMLRQLYLYAAAVRSVYGEFPKKLCFNSFRTQTLITEPFSEKAYNDALSWAEEHIMEIKNANEFRPHADYFQCRYLCGVHEQCCYYQPGR